MGNWTYFTDEEVTNLDKEFVARLDKARHAANTPFTITSGFRTPEENQSLVGSAGDSAHLKGLAVDLRVENSHEVWQIITGLISAGITRIGIYVDSGNIPTHIHCDVDPNKVQDVIFVKREANRGATATA